MRITDQKSVAATNNRPVRTGATGSGARFMLDSGASSSVRAESMAPVSILGGLEALIALQSEDPARERRKRSARRGQSMLDVLDDVKLALLSGHLPAELQARLAVMLREELPSGDARLDSIMEAIELRAAVELAKLKQAQAATAKPA